MSDWESRFLDALKGSRPAWDEPPDWRAALSLYEGLAPAEAAELDRTLVRMIDEEYRNPHSSHENLPFDDVMVNLPAGMTPDDLLCVEAAVMVAAERGIGEAFFAFNRLMRAPRWHAMYPRLHWLGHQSLEVQRRLGLTRAGRGLGALLGAAVAEQLGGAAGEPEVYRQHLDLLLSGARLGDLPATAADPRLNTALEALHSTSSFEACLNRALERDSAAAPAAGALAGAWYGPAAIPRRWTQELPNRPAVEEGAKRLYAQSY